MFSAFALIVAATGFATAFQSPTNTELSKVVGNAEATLVSFGGGFLILAVLVALFGQGNLGLLPQTQPWQWIGGLYGVFIVMVITYSIPVLGVALTLTAIILGEIAAGMVIDTFGWLGSTPIPFDALRLGGSIVIAAGIVIVYIGCKRIYQAKSTKLTGNSLLMLVLSLVAGMAGACQAPTNASLGLQIGSLEASLVSFAGGVIAIGIYTLVKKRGKLKPLTASAPWTWLGGLYGAAGVFFMAIATPVIGVGVTVTCMTLGQLVGGLVIDAFGLMRCLKLKIDAWRVSGVILIALGIVVYSISKIAL